MREDSAAARTIVLVGRPGGLAFVDAGFHQVQRTHRYRAAVHPALLRPIERREVAAHRLGGDVVGDREFRRGGHRDSTCAAMACWRSSGYTTLRCLLKG